MRILIDTNLLISAALNSNGTPYQAFVKARADVLLTGDKDFLEADIDNPVIVSAADFVIM